ncbi:MAG: 30S ribosomal protein S15 [Treponema sp.]|nr:30S ribosomal protein S15 [Candidatus Treponema scatequi]
MALTKEQSASLVTKFGANERDTGNTKVQIALLTARVEQLTAHVQNYPKDKSAKRSLLKVIGQRKKLLKYLQTTDLETYRSLIKELGLRK